MHQPHILPPGMSRPGGTGWMPLTAAAMGLIPAACAVVWVLWGWQQTPPLRFLLWAVSVVAAYLALRQFWWALRLRTAERSRAGQPPTSRA